MTIGPATTTTELTARTVSHRDDATRTNTFAALFDSNFAVLIIIDISFGNRASRKTCRQMGRQTGLGVWQLQREYNDFLSHFVVNPLSLLLRFQVARSPVKGQRL